MCIIILGLFVPFAISGKALVFSSLLTLSFGLWMSIGSMINVTHQPIWKLHPGNNLMMPYNCTSGVPFLINQNQQTPNEKRYFNSNRIYGYM